MGRETTIANHTSLEMIQHIQNELEIIIANDAAERGMYIIGRVEHEIEPAFYTRHRNHPSSVTRLWTWARCAPIIELFEEMLND